MGTYYKDYAYLYGSASNSSAGGDESGSESRVINGNSSSYHEFRRSSSISGGGEVSGNVSSTWTVTWSVSGTVEYARVVGTAWAHADGDGFNSPSTESYLDYVQLLVNGVWTTIRGRSNRNSQNLTTYANSGLWHNVTGMRTKFYASGAASSSDDRAEYDVLIRCGLMEARVTFRGSGFRGSAGGVTYDFLEDTYDEMDKLLVVDGKSVRCSTTGGLFPTPFKVQTNDGVKIIEGQAT